MGAKAWVTAMRRHKAAGVLFVGAFAVGLAPDADGDLWWHLAAGREIVRTHALPSVDPFSVSAAGRPWVDVHWLFQLAAYAIHCVGGLAALVVAKCLLVAMGAVTLQAAVEHRMGPRLRWVFVAALLAVLFLARHLIPVRPVVVTLLLLALFFRALEQFRCEGNPRVLWQLPLLQIGWVNVQGLFALGPILVASYWLDAILQRLGPSSSPSSDGAVGRVEGRRARALAATFALCTLACCATPYGLRVLGLPLKLLWRLVPAQLNVYATNVAENVPPWALERAMPGEFWHLKWFIALLAVSFVVTGRRVVVAHALIVAGLVALALAANRNVLLLYWLATPIAVLNIARAARRPPPWAMRLVRGTLARRLAPAAVAAPLALIGVAFFREPAFGQPAPFRFPEQSTAILADASGGGTIFAADNYGGYLIWQLYPRYRPYIDTRLVLRTPEEFAEYLAVADHPERFDEFQKRHSFDYVLLPTAYPDRYLDLAAHLYASGQWRLVYTDGTEILFARRERAKGQGWDLGSADTTDAILRNLDRRFGVSPRLLEASRTQLAALDIAAGAYDQAERILAASSDAAADALRARIRLASGDLSGARAIGEKLLGSDGDDVHNLNLMAMVSLRQGQAKPALHFLRRALTADPFDSEAERLLATLEEHVESP
jgi:tetratricopeptide (TPR) repeat protein